MMLFKRRMWGIIFIGGLFAGIFLPPSLEAQSASDSLYSLDLKKEPLRQTLKIISNRSGIQFIFKDGLVDNKAVTCSFSNETLEMALQKILSPHKLAYKIISSKIIALYLPVKQSKKARKIKGKVSDAETQIPLFSANVFLPDKPIGDATDPGGQFEFIIPDSSQMVRVSYMGYESRDVSLPKEINSLDIKLKPQPYAFKAISVEGDIIQERGINPVTTQTDLFFSQHGALNAMFLNTQSKPEAYQVYDNYGKTSKPVLAMNKVNSLNQENFRNLRRKTSCVENLTLLNDIEIEDPFHIKVFPGMDGAIFSRDMTSDYRLLTLEIGPQYGRVLNDLLLVNYRNGNQEALSTKMDLNFSDMSLLLEGPLLKDRGSWMIFGRKSYYDFLYQQLKEVPDYKPDFYDIQAQADFSVTQNIKLKFYLLRSQDNLKGASDEMNYSQQSLWYVSNPDNLYVGLENINEYSMDEINYTHEINSAKLSYFISHNLISELMVTGYLQRNKDHLYTYQSNSTIFPDYPEWSLDHTIANSYREELARDYVDWKWYVHYKKNALYSVETGLEYRNFNDKYENTHRQTDNANSELLLDPYFMENYDFAASDTTASESVRSAGDEFAYYLQNRFELSNDIIINLGFRANYFSLTEKFTMNPRFNVNYYLSKYFSIHAGWGIYSRRPHFKQTLHTAPKSTPDLQKAMHSVIGIKSKLTKQLNLDVACFYKGFSNLISTMRLSDGSLYYKPDSETGNGYSGGIKAELGYQNSFLSNRFVYYYNESNEKFAFSSKKTPRYFEQRHSCSAHLDVKPGKKLLFSFNYYWGSGYAFTPCIINESQEMIRQWILGDTNSDYLPPYSRLDFKFKIAIPGESRGLLQLYTEIYNVLNTRNVVAYNYTYDENAQPIREEISLYGIVPNVGLSISF